jgi:hypothetical protein
MHLTSRRSQAPATCLGQNRLGLRRAHIDLYVFLKEHVLFLFTGIVSWAMPEAAGVRNLSGRPSEIYHSAKCGHRRLSRLNPGSPCNPPSC